MSSLKEKLISFDTAKLAKKKGFNELSDSCYNIIGVISNNINNKNEDWTNNEIYSAPTQSLLQKWLREIHKINVNVLPYSTRKKYWEVVVEGAGYTWSGYETYEEALEEGLQHALKLIQK